MPIGDLYDANNVVVGQAAVFFAPKNTVLPAFTAWDQTDPFNPAYLLTYTIVTGSITSFTLTVTNSLGQATTSSLTVAGLTPAAIAAAVNALANVGAGGATVTGASTPFSLVLHGTAEGSTITMTPTGGAGGSITNPVWVPCGATDQGWTWSANKSTQTINIEEQSTPVATTITSQAISIAGALSEDISRTLNLALNATSATTAPATGTVPGYDTITLTDTVLTYAVAMVTTNAEGFGRIVYAPQWTQLSNAQVAFRRAADKRQYAVEFDTVCQTSAIKIYNFTITK